MNVINKGNTNYSQKTIGVAIHYAFPLIIDKTMEENFRNSCKVILWIAYSNKVSIDNFREKITEYMNLQQLDLGSLQLIYIPDEISQLKLCTYLRLKDNKLTDVPTSLLSMTWLIKLDLQYNQLSGIPLGIEKMSSLNEIWLEGNHFIRFPVSLSKVSRLQNIWLDNNQITKFEDCSMPNLQRLSITKNKSFSALDSLVRWELLQFLFLDENDLKSLSPEIKNLKQLKILHLNKNLLTQLPEEFGELKNLERLQIRENLLQELPARIGELLNLKSLNLYHNQLTKLPVTMAFMTQLEHLVLKGNPLQSPPIEICQDWSSIQTYFLDYLSGQKACNFVKMIVVGEENVGKTTLIRALKAYCSSWFTFSQDWYEVFISSEIYIFFLFFFFFFEGIYGDNFIANLYLLME